MAFATMKYPPGVFPSGGVYGEGAVFEQVRACFSIFFFNYVRFELDNFTVDITHLYKLRDTPAARF